MSTDDFILLVGAQWGRGLVIPDHGRFGPLKIAAERAVQDGLCYSDPVAGKTQAHSYNLAMAGWKRLGYLTGRDIQFR
jgi:hypothetical protein